MNAPTAKIHPAPGSPLAARSGERQSWYWLLAPVLLVALSVALLRYHATLAEPDLTRMMAALLYGEATGAHAHATYHYGLSFSFGYYQLLYALAPAGALRDPDLAAQLINDLGAVSALTLALTLPLLLESLFGRIRAAAIALVFLGSPMMLPFVISGHPMVAAGALFFLGAYLLLASLRHAQQPGRRGAAAAAGLLALAALTAGLTLRGEIVLGFPFVAIAAGLAAPGGTPAFAWRRTAAACALLLAAFAGFLWLQRPYLDAHGSSVSTVLVFIREFWTPGRILRGLAVFGMASGLASLALLGGAFLRNKGKLAVEPASAVLVAALALPALLFWLPNPQPARHFFFACFALAVLLGAVFKPYLKTMPAAIALGLACIAANQAAAELLRPLLVERYQWSYASTQPRRATQAVPLGAFAPDQLANRRAQDLKREEAIKLAAGAPARLVVLADFYHYLIGHLLARDPDLRITRTRFGQFEAVLLKNGSREIYFVEKQPVWPQDVLGAILRDERLKDWPVYIQPSTVSRHDVTPLPPARRFIP